MSTQRHYRNDARFGEDYNRVRAFLLAHDSANYSFGRWDWMMSHSMLAAAALPRIGLWEEAGEVVALAAFDTEPGGAYLLYAPAHAALIPAMLAHAEAHLGKAGPPAILLWDGDEALQSAAVAMGYAATRDREEDAVYPLEGGSFDFELPPGFRITTMAETGDYYQYGRVMWRGFNHEQKGEGPYDSDEAKLARLRSEFERPNVDPSIKIAVTAPDGNFVAYCGMWQDPACQSVQVEPVATDPDYRRMGLGRAAVLEGLRRCAARGAKRALVGSSQQFYYSIGFRLLATSTWWKKPS